MPELGDTNRNRGLKLLYEIFSSDEIKRGIRETKPEFELNSQISLELSLNIERSILDFVEQGEYTKYIRQRILLLKDRNNTDLKMHVLFGMITVDDFVKKSVDELNSEEQKKKREAALIWTAGAMQSDFFMKNADIKDGEFTCSKCKGKKIMSMQKQMRSADEPMTIFCYCTTCKHNWRMG